MSQWLLVSLLLACAAACAGACKTGDKPLTEAAPRPTSTSSERTPATAKLTPEDGGATDDADACIKQEAACLEAQTAITGARTCEGLGKRVCLVLLGQVSPELVNHLVRFYKEDCGLTISVLEPLAIRGGIFNTQRGQVDAGPSIDYAGNSFLDDYNNPDVTLIVLTPVDLYDSTTDYRFVFGIKGNAGNPRGIISTFRMDPRVYGEREDEELFRSRVRKFVSKYMGLLSFDLPVSAESGDPMYDPIYSLNDLDAMTEPLPIC